MTTIHLVLRNEDNFPTWFGFPAECRTSDFSLHTLWKTSELHLKLGSREAWGRTALGFGTPFLPCTEIQGFPTPRVDNNLNLNTGGATIHLFKLILNNLFRV